MVFRLMYIIYPHSLRHILANHIIRRVQDILCLPRLSRLLGARMLFKEGQQAVVRLPSTLCKLPYFLQSMLLSLRK